MTEQTEEKILDINEEALAARVIFIREKMLDAAEVLENSKLTENTNAIKAKNNANSDFNSAKENKSKAEQDVIEKKKLCSTCK